MPRQDGFGEPGRERTWRWPWEELPDDDGYRWSLRFARYACGAVMLFPLLFAAMAVAILTVSGRPHEEPVFTAALAVAALTVLPAAPFVRENIARAGIGAFLARKKRDRRAKAAYATFATASITGFMVAQAGALFGFIATALTREVSPLVIGSVASYLTWAFMWPRRRLWDRWTWQSRVRRDALEDDQAGGGRG